MVENRSGRESPVDLLCPPLLDRPGLSGAVVIHWHISETGEVPEHCITKDTVGDPGLATCVNELVRNGRFPAPRGSPIDVEFPFVFTPR